MDVFSTSPVRAAALAANHPLAGVLSARADVFAMTQHAEAAALTPRDAGGLSYAERAALACRIALINDEPGLATHFEQLMDTSAPPIRAIADPSFDGAHNARLAAILRHTDLVTRAPKHVNADDIVALREAGICEDDIVRLSQLIAFINYEARVCRGLRMMAQPS